MRMHRLLVLMLILLTADPIDAATPQNGQISVSLLTGDPGQDLYSYFGHTAIRVTDSVNGTDLVFNYGVFDFNTPNFYLKFLRGKLMYQLAVTSWEYTLHEYRLSGRRLTEQPLHLDSVTTARLVDFLKRNYRPENRLYLYDFFKDNCATRVRDALEAATEPDFLHYPSAANDQVITYRDDLHRILEPHPWTSFGIDLVLGRPADEQTNFHTRMFLPDILANSFESTTLKGQAVAGTPHEIVPPYGTYGCTAPLPDRPTTLFGALALLSLLSVWWTRLRWPPLADRLLALVAGLGGVLIIGLWFGTDHAAVKDNWNVLFLNPLALSIALWTGSRGKKALGILRALVGGLALAGGILAPLLPQDIHPAAALWGVALGVRLLHRSLSSS